jgi:hypothetical protein
LLKIGLVIGLSNLLAIAIRSQIFGDASVSARWYAGSLIVTFPIAMWCAWLLYKKASQNLS